MKYLNTWYHKRRLFLIKVFVSLLEIVFLHHVIFQNEPFSAWRCLSRIVHEVLPFIFCYIRKNKYLHDEKIHIETKKIKQGAFPWLFLAV